MSHSLKKQELIYYLSLIGHQINFLLTILNKLRSKSYPNSNPITLIEIMKRILTQSISELEHLHGQIGKMKNRDIADRAWLVHYYSTEYLSPWIEAIYNSNISTPMSGIINEYNYICNLVLPSTCLIIYPSWQYNYDCRKITEILESSAKNINREKPYRIFDEIYSNYFILTYPSIQDDAILSQVLLAHEVGHCIDSAFSWSEKIENSNVFTGIDLSFSKGVAADQQSLAIQLIHTFIPHWIKEIVADFIALLLLGPAFVLALDEFMFADPLIKSGSHEIVCSHPPVDLRLKLMSRVFLDIQDKYAEIIINPAVSRTSVKTYDKIRKTINDYSEQRLPIVTKIKKGKHEVYPLNPEASQWVFTQLTTAMKNAIEICKSIVTEKSFGWIFNLDDIVQALELVEILGQHCIPIKLSTQYKEGAPSFAALMNSGWYYLLLQKKKGSFSIFNNIKHDDVNKSLLSVHHLVAKAIEALNFRRNYMKQKGKEG